MAVQRAPLCRGNLSCHIVWAAAALLVATAPAAILADEGSRKIEHFVVLLMENRALDHVFGCIGGEGIIGLDGIPPEGRQIPIDGDDPKNGTVNVSHGIFGRVAATLSFCACAHTVSRRTARSEKDSQA